MKRGTSIRPIILASLCASITLAGCGGGGHESRPSTRQAVRKAIGRLIGVSHAENSGLQQSGLLAKGRSARSFGPRNASHGRGEAYDNESYYDLYHKLWRIDASTETTRSATFWLDEAAAQPAGTELTQLPSSDAYPATTTTTFSITAGPLSGSYGTSSDTQQSETSGTSSYDNHYPGSRGYHEYGNRVQNSDYSETWHDAADFADGRTYRFDSVLNADGTGTETAVWTDATTTTASYAADQSGNGSVANQVSGMSATFEWTPDGTTTIHYSDGTSETIVPG